MIDEIVSTTSPESKCTNGVDLAGVGEKSQNAQVTAFVQPSVPAGSYYAVAFEMGAGSQFQALHGFDSYTQQPFTFPVTSGMLYRFRHVSGAAARVSLVS